MKYDLILPLLFCFGSYFCPLKIPRGVPSITVVLTFCYFGELLEILFMGNFYVFMFYSLKVFGQYGTQGAEKNILRLKT